MSIVIETKDLFAILKDRQYPNSQKKYHVLFKIGQRKIESMLFLKPKPLEQIDYSIEWELTPKIKSPYATRLQRIDLSKEEILILKKALEVIE